jgi:hypothetical protein
MRTLDFLAFIKKHKLNLNYHKQNNTSNVIYNHTKLKTEDTGKILEYAVCLALNTPYKSSFKYSIQEAKRLAQKLTHIRKYFPKTYVHTANGGSPYDFTSFNTKNKYISCKSNKKGNKIAPHTIGQPNPLKFCKLLGIQFYNIKLLKKEIQRNVTIQKLLETVEKYTFDAPIIYYQKKEDNIKIIKKQLNIVWENANFSWTRCYKEWKNSSTLKVNNVSLLEIQFHEKSRTNMAVRLNLKKCIQLFPNCFKVITL